jgi:hypothetical protein
MLSNDLTQNPPPSHADAPGVEPHLCCAHINRTQRIIEAERKKHSKRISGRIIDRKTKILLP